MAELALGLVADIIFFKLTVGRVGSRPDRKPAQYGGNAQYSEVCEVLRDIARLRLRKLSPSVVLSKLQMSRLSSHFCLSVNSSFHLLSLVVLVRNLITVLANSHF